MPTGLLNCAHCDGAPLFIAGRLQAVVVCEECGVSTPPVRLESTDSDTAFAQLQAIWNTRVEHRPADEQTISMLARRELTASDIPYFLNLLASTAGDWTSNGPKFAAMAAALARPGVDFRDVSPPETVLEDAGRYRKLVRRSKVIYIDGAPMVRFDHVPAMAAAIAEEAKEDDPWPFPILEEFVARAVDSLPDSAQP
ncbi:conserved protein of unknown function (plasmid) [Cupriavidus taiwanensis]|uniref:Uncharacterized protein n=1 Tax=Cupriavidus taiwanensis TaxID=164546 RepID=A0A375EFN7_9BURK|nr:hypothetical protein [Cupriavidus taiwanensis]SOZ72681.1 conserved hypothetical protein [Cupriavidus taiwanensis]SOZ73352.1 conserved hypothetical protein [Cupriavidus taiwanensis]SOZ75161.1 conserved hypothetical protein [Cupriavidus taiwanensis]SPA03730.1 conserved protein of unknown function [Cupriavidus taiwanensis]SPA11634.1 conserved protein of unknown function [Cupriavidus taiwanensis]